MYWVVYCSWYFNSSIYYVSLAWWLKIGLQINQNCIYLLYDTFNYEDGNEVPRQWPERLNASRWRWRTCSPTRHACRSVTTPTPNFSTWPSSRDKQRTTSTCYLLTNRMIDSWTRHRTWTSLSKFTAPQPPPPDRIASYKILNHLVHCFKVDINFRFGHVSYFIRVFSLLLNKLEVITRRYFSSWNCVIQFVVSPSSECHHQLSTCRAYQR